MKRRKLTTLNRIVRGTTYLSLAAFYGWFLGSVLMKFFS